MSWTPERIDQLKALWANPANSGSTIASILRVSKNAVLGKAHRLGLPSRPSPIKADAQPRAPIPMRQPKVTLPLMAMESAPGVAPTTPFRMVDVSFPPPPPSSRHRCCWPLWPDKGPTTHQYCDAPVLMRGEAASSYCPDHYARAYTRWVPSAAVLQQRPGAA
ncbi:hypothetical protein EOD42_08980 [Rhodovarius crocodyli]|uniref:GcrA cell cycle regulator n=1 Tax=Rhodovarius crocodyli TaxID=1979269 RepID=A0A437MJV7_9PROT|nr:GcrA family cell cycle regulator [Rhodovarius crocodyli]RVT97913.1 hypothetical protein EOD42_08980 [Rhodovarius crocodyli]